MGIISYKNEKFNEGFVNNATFSCFQLYNR